MTMAIIPAQTGRISGSSAPTGALGLFLLLLGPLMWFGIVYLGSLLTLLWQSIYTFDDFTMSVTSDFTLANLRALFNPANYDIIVRTLVMALSRHAGQRAAGAADGLVYGALYQRQNEGLLYIAAALLPMWASYIVKAYAWVLLLAKDGVAQWFLGHLGLGGAERAVERPGGWRQYLVHLRPWTLWCSSTSGCRLRSLPVQAALERIPGSLLQASADLGAGPAADLSLRGAAAGHSRHRRWVDLHLFADARATLSCRSWWARRDTLSAIWFTSQQGAIGNMPMAAAFTLVPIVLIALYLAFVKRLGASSMHSERAPWYLSDWRPGAGVIFLHFPLLIIANLCF